MRGAGGQREQHCAGETALRWAWSAALDHVDISRGAGLPAWHARAGRHYKPVLVRRNGA